MNLFQQLQTKIYPLLHINNGTQKDREKGCSREILQIINQDSNSSLVRQSDVTVGKTRRTAWQWARALCRLGLIEVKRDIQILWYQPRHSRSVWYNVYSITRATRGSIIPLSCSAEHGNLIIRQEGEGPRGWRGSGVGEHAVNLHLPSPERFPNLSTENLRFSSPPATLTWSPSGKDAQELGHQFPCLRSRVGFSDAKPHLP